MDNNAKFKWLHLLCMATVIVALLTGFRIHLLDSNNLLASLSPILPQGQIHSWHFKAGIVLIALLPVYWIFGRTHVKPRRQRASIYHRSLHRAAYVLLPLVIITGIALWVGNGSTDWRTWHFYSVSSLCVYIILHGYVYFLQLGRSLLNALFSKQMTSLSSLLFVGLFFIAVSMMWQSVSYTMPDQLNVHSISPQTAIQIDGMALEPFWQQTPSISIVTGGGANFKEGRSLVTVQAVANNNESYFLFRWQDPTESLTHLPLEKRLGRWQVVQEGYEHFDEQTYYEDKFAVMLSSTCGHGADGTIHLGHKPLPDKPANWHGKGYHASLDGRVRDLWHWKAVRTNNMYQADDNAFSYPLSALAGERRYTAGYQADGKESGAYVSNWQWFNPLHVQPKRLPFSQQDNQYVLAWFDSRPYKAKHDNFPNGTRIPSTLYRSNRFEGDRGDVRARAQWHEGEWTLELARKNQTGSELDVSLVSGTCLWVAAFDGAQIAHTRHQRPIKLDYQP